MKILVTGSAGFIGAALTKALLARGDTVVGIDNHNNYYDPALKEARLALFADHTSYTHLRADIADRDAMRSVFEKHQPEVVVNLAAQAGVRYSLENPSAYIDSNIVGFANILEGCRLNNVKHLVYASSSSVYGAIEVYPFSEEQNVDRPISLYAATKKSNELMAYAYSHLYKLQTTGLRFFTVYGPWGRPDMALFKFVEAIIQDKPITLYNFGDHKRDFTFIDDVVEGILLTLDAHGLSLQISNNAFSDEKSIPYEIFNLASGISVPLMDYVKEIEKSLDKKANKKFLQAQLGDVHETLADITSFSKYVKFVPRTDYKTGIAAFVNWYLTYKRE